MVCLWGSSIADGCGGCGVKLPLATKKMTQNGRLILHIKIGLIGSHPELKGGAALGNLRMVKPGCIH
jgi:hypothetical protein